MAEQPNSGKYVSFIVGDRMVHVPELAAAYFKANVNELVKLANISQPGESGAITTSLANAESVTAPTTEIGTITIPMSGNSSDSNKSPSMDPLQISTESALDQNNSSNVLKSNITWTQDATRKLIAIYKKNLHLFNDPINKRKNLWIKVSQAITAAGFKATPLQCENRWKHITHQHRNNLPITASNIYAKELSEIFNSTYKPPPAARKGKHMFARTMYESPKRSKMRLGQTGFNHSKDDEEDDDDGSESNYSASNNFNKAIGLRLDSSAIQILENMHKQKMAMERRKLEALSNMHQEKMRALRELIGLMKEGINKKINETNHHMVNRMQHETVIEETEEEQLEYEEALSQGSEVNEEPLDLNFESGKHNSIVVSGSKNDSGNGNSMVVQ